MNPICFHHNDPDGRLSAAIVQRTVDNVELVEVKYGDDWSLDQVKDRLVYVVDFSFPDMLALKRACKTLVWIDHHQSAKDRNELIWESKDVLGDRDVDRAACELTWLFFNEEFDMPNIVKYVGDYDAWKFEYEEKSHYAHEFFATLDLKKDKEDIEYLLNNRAGAVMNALNFGKLLYDAKLEIAKDIANHALLEMWEGHKTVRINCSSKKLVSLVGQVAMEQHPEADIIFMYHEMTPRWMVSLRSKTVDVAKIAEKYGGGGHKGASGFSMKIVGHTHIKD